MTFDVLKPKIATLISDSNSKDLTLQLICELLKTDLQTIRLSRLEKVFADKSPLAIKIL